PTKMWRSVFIVILMGQLSHQQQQQDLCGQTILQHLALIMEARFTQLDIMINEIASRQDINHQAMVQKVSEIDHKISNNNVDKLAELLASFKDHVIGEMEIKFQNMTTELQVMKENLTEENSQINSNMQSLEANFIDTNSEYGYMSNHLGEIEIKFQNFTTEQQVMKENLTEGNLHMNFKLRSMEENLNTKLGYISNHLGEMEIKFQNCTTEQQVMKENVTVGNLQMNFKLQSME
ncbi:unnamed protein product, partial [Meganyctiphanes norvegica]